MKRLTPRSPLPGFWIGATMTFAYLFAMLLLPLAACATRTAMLCPSTFWSAVASPRALAAYRLTFGASAVAACVNVVIGLLLAWVLARYRFRGRAILDAMLDLPFALPTAVTGLVFAGLLAPNGWYGQFLAPLGLPGAYSRFAIVVALVFVGLPFVVRTVQPVLESMEAELEEAAASLGATRWQTFLRVLLPALCPGLVAGFALSFARGLGEYGAIIFVSGNMPFRTEIAPVLIVERLEQFAYAEATAIAVVLLAGSFVSLGFIQWLERRSQAHVS